MLLARFRPSAPAFKVLLPATLTSPAPSEALFPTCTTPPPLKMVPFVPANGPYVLAVERIVVPAPFNVSVSLTPGLLAMLPATVKVAPLPTVATVLSFKATAVLMAFCVPAETERLAPTPLLSKVRVSPLFAMMNEFALVIASTPTDSLASKVTVRKPAATPSVAASPAA